MGSRADGGLGSCLRRLTLHGTTLHRRSLDGDRTMRRMLNAVWLWCRACRRRSAYLSVPGSVVLVVHNINVFAMAKISFLRLRGLISTIDKDCNEEDKVTNDGRGREEHIGEMQISYALFGRQIIRGYVFLGVFFIYSCRLTAEKDQKNGKESCKDYKEKLSASRSVEYLVCKGLTVQPVKVEEKVYDHGSKARAAGVHYRKKKQTRKEIHGEKCQPEMEHGKKCRGDDRRRTDAESLVLGAKDRTE